MSQDSLASIPTRAQLAMLDPESFVLQVAPEQGVRVAQLEVLEGVPMSRHYECYSLLLTLPQGVQLPANTYRLFGSQDMHWTLLFTPLMPRADGRHVLEAVIHRGIEPAAGAQA